MTSLASRAEEASASEMVVCPDFESVFSIFSRMPSQTLSTGEERLARQA